MQKSKIDKLWIILTVAFIITCAYFLWRGDYGVRTNDADLRDTVQQSQRDVQQAQSGISSARRENQSARESLTDLEQGIGSASDRVAGLQDQAAADRKLIAEIRDGNAKCRGLSDELERTLADVERQNQKAGAQNSHS